MNKVKLFESVGKVNEKGVSDSVNISKIEGLETGGNGGAWFRFDNSSFAKKYIIATCNAYGNVSFSQKNISPELEENVRLELKEELEKGTYPKNNSVILIKTLGYNSYKKPSNSIKRAIRKSIVKICVQCGASKAEIDHKDGRKQGLAMDSRTQKKEDFQALCKHCNDVKRERCKKCKETGIRFDAKQIPMLKNKPSYTSGNAKYENTCKGCFLYDIEDYGNHI